MYSAPYYIESYFCDFNEKVRLANIVNYLLLTSTQHAENFGFGFNDLIKENKTWVLSRFILEILNYPKSNAELNVTTWIEDVTRAFTQRCFSLHVAGRPVGYARTIWAAIDFDTRRPVNILDWRPDLSNYIENNIACLVEKPGKIPAVHCDISGSFDVKYNDIDVNRHVNSIRYIEHITDMFDIEMFNKKEIQKLEIHYLTESVFGDTLSLYKQELAPDEFIIDMRKNDVSVCRSRVGWN
jgi:acyl-ACP thioesterase